PRGGSAGRGGWRSGGGTAIARALPAWAWRRGAGMLSSARPVGPPIMLFMTSLVLRNGACVISVPVAIWNITEERCDDVPMPEEPKFTLPGLAFRYATSSGTVFAGTFGLTNSRFGSTASSETGARSCSTSKLSLVYRKALMALELTVPTSRV